MRPQTMRPPQLPMRVCAVHGLAAGPDGRCALCHRADQARDQAGPWRQLAGLVVAAIAIVVGVVVWKGDRKAAGPIPASASAAAPPPVALAPPAEVKDEPDLANHDEAKEQQHQQRVMDEQDRQAKVVAAMKDVPVVMYSTKPCAMCDAARDWMKGDGMAFREIDVGRDEAALAAMHKLTPTNEVPVFDVDGEVILGFAPGNLSGAVRRAADRRARAR